MFVFYYTILPSKLNDGDYVFIFLYCILFFILLLVILIVLFLANMITSTVFSDQCGVCSFWFSWLVFFYHARLLDHMDGVFWSVRSLCLHSTEKGFYCTRFSFFSKFPILKFWHFCFIFNKSLSCFLFSIGFFLYSVSYLYFVSFLAF